MVRVVDLYRDPVDDLLLADLAGKDVYLVGNADLYGSLLAAHGVQVKSVAHGIPQDAVLLVAPPESALLRLKALCDRLLGPAGCPWDQAQSHETLKKNLLEEAYEVLDAIDSGNEDALCEELGDLLLQPMLHAAIRRKNGGFDADAVARGIVEKLLRRHPHVFGDHSVSSPEEALRSWDRIKKQEKKSEGSILSGVPTGMASLLRAYEVSKRAARSGFEWPNLAAVFAKLDEEIAELHEAIESEDADHIEAEIGDLLFTAVNIARWLRAEPEEALRRMLNRFTSRFQAMERMTETPLAELTPEAWDALWERAKAQLAAENRA